MNSLPELKEVRQKRVRPAYRILAKAYSSVEGLFEAVEFLDAARRASNESTRGRKSVLEVDILRSAIVFTSAGLDAAMKRLVTDVGRDLVVRAGTGANQKYKAYLREEMRKSDIPPSFRDAIMGGDPGKGLLDLYLEEKTKASFQGSGELEARVREVLGIKKSSVPDSVLKSLDAFFLARNDIVHRMDLRDLASSSSARQHRDIEQVAHQCGEVFSVSVSLIYGAAEACKIAGL